MTKQYRLKITWSNGDSEIISTHKYTETEMHDYMNRFVKAAVTKEAFVGFYDVCMTAHIRKFEFEEVIKEKEVRL